MIPPVSALGRPLPCRQIVDRQDDQIGHPFERPRLPVSRRSAYGDRHLAFERLIDKGGSHQPPTTRLPVEELKR